MYIFISLLLIAWSKEASCTGSNGNSSDSSKGRAEPILSHCSPERKSNKASHLGLVTELDLTDSSRVSAAEEVQLHQLSKSEIRPQTNANP